MVITVIEKLKLRDRLQNLPVSEINGNSYLKGIKFPPLLHSSLYSSSYIYLLPPSLHPSLLPYQEVQKSNKSLRLVSQEFLEFEETTISISWRKIHPMLPKDVAGNVAAVRIIMIDFQPSFSLFQHAFMTIWELCVAQPLPSTMKEMKEHGLVPEILWSPCCSGWCGDQSYQKSHCTW